jgi:hypothetical protein
LATAPQHTAGPRFPWENDRHADEHSGLGHRHARELQIVHGAFLDDLTKNFIAFSGRRADTFRHG